MSYCPLHSAGVLQTTVDFRNLDLMTSALFLVARLADGSCQRELQIGAISQNKKLKIPSEF